MNRSRRNVYKKLCVVLSVCSVLIVELPAEQCTTPNNEKSECISLYECPELLTVLSTLHNIFVDFLAKATCGGTPVNPMVCCPTTSKTQPTTQQTTTTKPSKSSDKYKLLAGKVFCGLQHSDDYVRPTDAVSINELPWIARIGYVDAENVFKGYKCSGSLINRQYVMTGAVCLGKTKLGLVAHSVRLGEYNSKSETDCVNEDPLLTECSAPVEDFGIEEVVRHADHSERNVANDIGLIRLNKTVDYSDYIRPICLPIPGTKLPTVDDTVVTSGWGPMQTSDGYEVAIKKKIFSIIITAEECTAAYYNAIKATENHLCTRVLPNNTDAECVGDNGGPVMVARGHQWYQVGIISTRHSSQCAEEEFPQIDTNVAKYIDWIVEKIKP